MADDNVISLYSDARLHPRLAESEVTTERLQQYLDAAVFDYVIDDDGDIYVKDGTEFPVWLVLDEDNMSVGIHTYWVLNGCRAEDVNRLNAKYRIVQFALRKDRVVANYCLPYRYGLDTRHLIIMARHFGSICHSARNDLQEIADEFRRLEEISKAPRTVADEV